MCFFQSCLCGLDVFVVRFDIFVAVWMYAATSIIRVSDKRQKRFD